MLCTVCVNFRKLYRLLFRVGLYEKDVHMSGEEGEEEEEEEDVRRKEEEDKEYITPDKGKADNT